MNRRLRTNLPLTDTQLKPCVPDFTTVKLKEEEQKRKQKIVFDSRHSARNLDPLLPGEKVWIQDHNTEGRVIEPAAPRSYCVSIPTGTLRRNRTHLRRIPDESETVVSSQSSNVRDSSDTTVTRSGHVSRPPTRWSPGENT